MYTLQKNRIMHLLLVVAVALASTTLAAKDKDKKKKKNKDKPNPYMKADNTWISISGTAVSSMPDGFTLDYGEGTVLVEMDDWDWYDESHAILEGDKVTVYGDIDDDFFETTSIEAGSVYVESLGSYFYASSADEEGSGEYWVSYSPIIVGDMIVRGTVDEIYGREFTIDTGYDKLRVDTIMMPYNPLDDKGYQKVEKGDYISVSGNMDYDFWEKRELMADTIITLVDESDDS